MIAIPSGAQDLFHARYGTDFQDYANMAIPTADGNFVVAGSTQGFGSMSNAFIMKLDGSGSQIWARDYSGINVDEIFSIIEGSNGELVACGATYSFGAGSWDGFIMKTDAEGNMIWGRTYGNEYADLLYKIAHDGEGGYYVTGYAQTAPIPSTEGMVLMRLDSLGALVWRVWVPGGWNPNGAIPIDLAVTPQSDLLLTGSQLGNGHLINLWKITADGQLLWSKAYDYNWQGQRIAIGTSGDIFLTGLSDQGVSFSVDFSVVKLDGLGNVLWCKSYGGTYYEFATAICALSNGGIAIGGYTTSSGGGGEDAFLIEIDGNGAVQWGRTYGTIWTDKPKSVVRTTDAGFILSGGTFAYGTDADSLKAYVVKTDDGGNSACHSLNWTPISLDDSLSYATPLQLSTLEMQENTLAWASSPRVFTHASICVATSMPEATEVRTPLSAFPNPFTDRVTILAQGGGATKSELLIRNMLGQLIYRKVDVVVNEHSPQVIHLGHLPVGVYSMELLVNGTSSTTKIIKQ